jgi:hypothetical protein
MQKAKKNFCIDKSLLSDTLTNGVISKFTQRNNRLQVVKRGSNILQYVELIID